MAYVQDEEQQGTPGAGGQVLAGSGGSKSGTGQVAGTGFTNLQKYLSANQGQGAGIAGDITSQGQQAVDAERAKADAGATAWGDTGVKQANDSASKAATVYDSTSNALKADPNYQYSTDVWGTTYGGPQGAQDVSGFNDLDKAYQNVKNTASSFANDRMTQQAGLQNKYGYGSGFAALDTFLGRQDGRDKIQGWAAGVDPGSAQGQVDRVNNAIGVGKQQVATAKSGFEQANDAAHIARRDADRAAQPPPTSWGDRGIASQAEVTPLATGGRGIADQVDIVEPAPPPTPAQPTLGASNVGKGAATPMPVESIPSSVGKGAAAPMPVKTVNVTPVGKGAATPMTTKTAAKPKPKPTYGRKG